MERSAGDGGAPAAPSAACRRPDCPGRHQLDNAAASLAALDALWPRAGASAAAARRGVAGARLSGRLQWLDAPERVLVDVAHNPLCTEALAAYLAASRPRPMRRAVCGILGDKDAGAMLRALAPEIGAWYFASVPGSRGRGAAALSGLLPRAAAPVSTFDSVEAAFEAALADRGEGEEVVVFGSFAAAGRVLRLATSRSCPET